jgi:fatty acid desaturase
MTSKIKYNRNPEDERLLSLFRKRVADYFTDRKLSRKANREAKLKTILLLSIFSGSYLLMLTGGFGALLSFLLAIVCGLVMVMIVYNISHDASHNALFESGRINRILSLTFNLAGGSAYMWHITHDEIHHTYANVTGIDADLDQAGPYLRLTQQSPYKWYHRYQYYYVWIIYSIYTLYLVFVKDLEDYRIITDKGSPLMVKKALRIIFLNHLQSNLLHLLADFAPDFTAISLVGNYHVLRRCYHDHEYSFGVDTGTASRQPGSKLYSCWPGWFHLQKLAD